MLALYESSHHGFKMLRSIEALEDYFGRLTNSPSEHVHKRQPTR
jgi:hypothetical protein